MQVTATGYHLRISPKKVRSLSESVKKMRLEDALTVLRYTNKKGASLIQKVIESAIYNAKNNFKLDKNNLFIKNIEVKQGPAFKRWRAVSRGAAHGYKKRTSHIQVILESIKELPKVEKQVKERKNGS